jgi:hypothetical protein
MHVKQRMLAMIVLAVVSAGASPAVASPEGTYRIRNASGTPLSCMLRVERGESFYRFGLRPGSEIRPTLDLRHGGRLLICSSSVYRRFTFRVESGRAYELTETSHGELRLRTISSP